jgi:7-keto-8-aminopelargonate synthetase-like enzyme
METPMPVDSRATSLNDYIRFESPDLFSKVIRYQGFLSDLRARDLEKYLLRYVSFNGGTARVQDDRTAIVHDVQVYCSADYLDLGRDRRVAQAAKDATDRFGVSVSSVPLIAGSTVIHGRLETELASFLGYESCVLFPTGQGANVSTIAALCTSSDSLVIDKQVHHSVLEGVKLTGAQWRSFRHSDPDHLASVLEAVRKRRPSNGILVIIEGVYGLDGDVAPLPDILEVSRRYDARVMLDDAHATGVLGCRGAGTAEHFSMADRPDILMGSFSKAFGSFGGFIAAARPVVEYLRYFAKSISFSIGLPPANAAAALESLHLLRDDPTLVTRLWSRHARLRECLVESGFQEVTRSQSAIMSVLVGSESNVKESTRDLFNAGIWAEGLPFPAVSRGQERIRFRARLSHTDEQIDEAVRVVRKTAETYGYLRPAAISVGGAFGQPFDGRASRLMELVYASNHQRSVPPSWFTSSYKKKQIEKSDFWEEGPFEQEWFHAGHGPYTAAVCAMTFLDRGTTVGALGHFAWLPGQDDALLGCIGDGLDWLKKEGVSVVYSPMQLPLQVLGAGLLTGDGCPEGRPFLEATNDSNLLPILARVGFEPVRANSYYKIDLAAVVPIGQEIRASVSFRNVDREHLRRDIGLMAPLLNETVSTLPLCSQLTERFLYGIASELRDLIVPGFWQFAFAGDQLIGFITAFPNIAEAMSQVCGMADVADLVKVSDALDSVDEGFVAWMGVLPCFADATNLGAALLEKVFSAMKQRGARSAWLSWELHNGVRQISAADLAPQQSIARLDYIIHRLLL